MQQFEERFINNCNKPLHKIDTITRCVIKQSTQLMCSKQIHYSYLDKNCCENVVQLVLELSCAVVDFLWLGG